MLNSQQTQGVDTEEEGPKNAMQDPHGDGMRERGGGGLEIEISKGQNPMSKAIRQRDKETLHSHNPRASIEELRGIVLTRRCVSGSEIHCEKRSSKCSLQTGGLLEAGEGRKSAGRCKRSVSSAPMSSDMVEASMTAAGAAVAAAPGSSIRVAEGVPAAEGTLDALRKEGRQTDRQSARAMRASQHRGERQLPKETKKRSSRPRASFQP